MKTLRWGIMGTSAIARLFAAGLAASRGGRLHAVGSRAEATAASFAREFGAPRAHASYESLAADPDVDAVYVASPHSEHKANTLLALRSGKPVLCEKPFAINAGEAREMIAEARARKLFLMEAMWTRYFPIMAKVREMVRAGELGEIRMVEADFGFRAEREEGSRLFDPRFGGGSLLDVGIYPLSFASMLLGKPRRVSGAPELGPTGVDEQAAVILEYESGALAVCRSAIRTETPQEATIIGTTGYLRIHAPFWRPSAMTLFRDEKAARRFELPYEGNGYNYEADEVARCLAAGLIESEIMPLDESLELMEIMDALRAQWGLRYPME